MRIAVLILLHKNPVQAKRLISVLQHDDIDIFIHIDKKCDFDKDCILKDSNFKNVFFTHKRHSVGLYQFSMLDAEKELLKTAAAHDSYQYFVLLSGQCYPIKTIEYIFDFLDKSYPQPFIDIVSQKEDNYVKINFNNVYINKSFKLKSYDFLKKHFSYKGYRILRFIPGGIAKLNSAIKELFVSSPQKRLAKIGAVGYCGSQWWILPDTMIKYILERFEDKTFCSIISDAFSCDESFFQTAIMMSPMKSHIVLDQNNDYKNGMWYFVFENGSHPFVLKQGDFDKIIASDKLFARKFDMCCDGKILDLLDKEVHMR